MPPSALFAFIHAAHAVEAALDTSLAEIGLSGARFGVLDVLARAEGPVALRALAEQQSCVPSNITQLVDRLTVDGLVTRTHDPSDRRSVLAALTDLGRSRHAEGLARIIAAERAFEERIPPADLPALRRVLGALEGVDPNGKNT